jgi:hypothetical protein
MIRQMISAEKSMIEIIFCLCYTVRWVHSRNKFETLPYTQSQLFDKSRMIGGIQQAIWRQASNVDVD